MKNKIHIASKDITANRFMIRVEGTEAIIYADGVLIHVECNTEELAACWVNYFQEEYPVVSDWVDPSELAHDVCRSKDVFDHSDKIRIATVPKKDLTSYLTHILSEGSGIVRVDTEGVYCQVVYEQN